MPTTDDNARIAQLQKELLSAEQDCATAERSAQAHMRSWTVSKTIVEERREALRVALANLMDEQR